MIAIRVLASTLVFLPIAVTAAAQTTPPPTTTTGTTSTTETSTTAGSYDRLSIGNRKIARALFEAQTTETTTQGTGGTSSAGSPITLDEISAMKQPGQGWGQVFKQLKEQGLVSQKNLGQVVSQYNKQQASRSETTTAANRTADDGTTPSSGSSDKGDRASGVGNSGGQGTKHTGASYTAGGRGSGAGGAASQGGGQGIGKSK